MPESFATKVDRWKFNIFPAYRGSGARVVYISANYRELRVKIPLSWRTRNYVGTIYGGSMYGGIDPIYMLMLIKNLGREYIVWDKAAQIRFKRSGKETLFAEFLLTQEELDLINGAEVICQSSVSSIRAFVEIDESVRRKMVTLPNGYGLKYKNSEPVGPQLNLLTPGSNCESSTKTPFHKYLPIKIRKVG